MRLTLIVVFTLLFFTSHAQDFGALGSEWYFRTKVSSVLAPEIEYIHYKSVADTTINSVVTHKITKTIYTYTLDTIPEAPYYVYQSNDTVFRYSFQEGKFLTMYIFGGNIGDTLTLDSPDEYIADDPTYKITITDTFSVTVDNQTLKGYKIQAFNNIGFLHPEIIENIGNLSTFEAHGPVTLDFISGIRCFKNNQLDTNFLAIPCDYLLPVSTPEYTSTSEVQMYPNPSQSKVYIDSDQPIESIIIFNALGQVVNQAYNYFSFDISALKNGHYWVQITTTDQKVTTLPIVKN